MINGLEGIPGSGKSYEAVAMHILPALKAGRRVITNLPLLVPVLEALDSRFAGLVELRTKSQPVRGNWDAEGIDSKGNGQAFQLYSAGYEAEPIRNVPIFGSVWDYYSEWKHPESGLGPLFIIDEAHLALPTLGTSQDVIEWYKLHRHFNADVLLATQSFRDINQPIARLLAILIKCRKADILGKSDCYIRKVHAGYRGAVISTETRKYEKQFFGLYRSHTQGNSVTEAMASDVSPLLTKLRRFTWMWWAVTIAFAAWAFWPKSKAAPPPRVVSTAPVGSNGVALVAAPAATASAPLQAVSAPAAPPPQDLEPLKEKLVHITGWIKGRTGTVYMFAVSQSGMVQFPLTGADLKAAGYVIQPMGECMAYLKWQDKTRSITCDVPAMAVGSNNAPVVMDAGTGRRSDEGRHLRPAYSTGDLDRPVPVGFGGSPPSSEARPTGVARPPVSRQRGQDVALR